MRILFVSPFPNDNDLYPHLGALYTALGRAFAVDYCYVPERGYAWNLTARLFRNPFSKNFFRGLRHLLRLALGCYRLARQGKASDVLLPVDNFLYVLCCTLFPGKRVILWSHDFISYDQERWSSLFQPTVARKTARFLARRREIIIQDEERLALLQQSIEYADQFPALCPFYLPVSLPAVTVEQKKFCLQPMVMQVGGIREQTMSIKLVEEFQRDTCSFELYLHGFIGDDVVERANACSRVPVLSGVRLSADRLPSLVARADIGFIYYDGTGDLNYYTIRNASCQLAEFLRVGKPLIGMGNTNLRELFAQQRIGRYIDDMTEIDAATDDIVNNYATYSANCKELFASHYDMDVYVPRLGAWLLRNDAVDPQA